MRKAAVECDYVPKLSSTKLPVEILYVLPNWHGCPVRDVLLNLNVIAYYSLLSPVYY